MSKDNDLQERSSTSAPQTSDGDAYTKTTPTGQAYARRRTHKESRFRRHACERQ